MGVLSLSEKGRVARLQLLMVLASAVIFGSDTRGTRDGILLSQIRDFPYHRLLRLAGLRWRYSTPPPHGNQLLQSGFPSDSLSDLASFYNFALTGYNSLPLRVPALTE
jgi:hypothetical protein